MNIKRIYNCYYKECSCGIGDFLRGSVFLKQALDQVGINFDIDFTYHPISSFLVKPSVVNYEKEEIFDVEKFIKKDPATYLDSLRLKTQEILNLKKSKIFLLTNFSDCIFLDTKDFAKIGMSNECRKFFQKRIKFTKPVHNLFKSINLPKKYNVVHFRCGDYELVSGGGGKPGVTNNKNYKVDYQQCLALVRKIKNPIVLSDSNKLKYFLEENGCKIIHKNSQHSSANPGSITGIQYEDDKMLHVCLDMLIMSKASSIQTYSVYPWFSGFSFWTAKIHNVPIYNNMIGSE
jgi:hypothetical protein